MSRCFKGLASVVWASSSSQPVMTGMSNGHRSKSGATRERTATRWELQAAIEALRAIKRDGNPVANIPQWKELDQLMHQVGVRVEFEWVKGHKASATNKQADKLTKASARGAHKPRLSRSTVRRKISAEKTKKGSVGMEGQRLTIRTIEDEWSV